MTVEEEGRRKSNDGGGGGGGFGSKKQNKGEHLRTIKYANVPPSPNNQSQ
jgi:hypothetical protein